MTIFSLILILCFYSLFFFFFSLYYFLPIEIEENEVFIKIVTNGCSCITTLVLYTPLIPLKEIIICALNAQVNDSNVEIIYWNVCIVFNL